jgi:stage II sporulation protein P
VRRRLGRRKRKKAVAAAAALTGLIGIGILGEWARQDSLLEAVLRQGKNEGYMRILKTAAPSLFYEDFAEDLKEYEKNLIIHMIPIYGYVENAKEYATQMESDISYEMIIAREASDENYVDDATGEVVLSGELAMDNGETGAIDEEAATDNEETETIDDETASDSSFQPNQTPVAT